ncbi:MAG: hypothetical protein M1450_03625 [Patescibacteria group bacterium]|nr:hypothetical protein [Patescibacteria group bacterium]
MFNTFFQRPKKPIEYFAALSINKDIVGAAIFTIEENKVKVLGTSFEKYATGWDSLIEAADLAISKSAGEVDLTNIKKVVFGFPPNYLEGERISKEVLPYLKKLTSELELTPSGFVVIPEAINFYLEEKEGGPQTSILVGVNREEITISHFRGGKLAEQVVIKRSESITRDIENALEGFKEVEIFPSKIILYDGGDLEAVKEELLKYPWQTNSKFLHFPKIVTLSTDFCLMSIIEAAVSELNKNITILGSEEKETKEKTGEKQAILTSQKVSAEELGFRKENDFDSLKDTELSEVPKTNKKAFKLSLPRISLPSFFRLRQFSFMPISLIKNKLILIALLIFIVIIGGYLYVSYSLASATLTLIVDPKVFDQEKEFSVNPDIVAVDEINNQIPGKTIETQVSGTKTVTTTGKKIIGDPAKGVITIYNKTGSVRTFDKGTKISAKNLVFTLDDKIDVPSATESGEGLSYGKANISLTAAKIGPEGNLSSQTEFTISDFSSSSYSGRNGQAFSGGTSREVTAVSAKDQDNVTSELTKELKNQAVADLSKKLVSGEKLLEESLNGETVDRKFSVEVDQEAKELTLNLTMKYQVLVYKDSDLGTLIEKIVKSNIPEGYQYVPEQTTFQISQILSSDEDKAVRFKATFNAKLFPKIDTEKITKDISGLSVKKLDSFVKTIQYVAGYEINFQTPLSLFQDRLPKLSKNIKVEIKAR